MLTAGRGKRVSSLDPVCAPAHKRGYLTGGLFDSFPQDYSITKSNSNEKLNVSKANGTFNKEIFAASAAIRSLAHWPLLILFNFQLKD